MTNDTAKVETEASIEKMTAVVRALKDMLASDGWKFYISHVQEQALRRRNQVLFEPLPSMDQVLLQEFLKGEHNGWAAAGELPQTIVDDYTERLQQLRAAQESQDENE